MSIRSEVRERNAAITHYLKRTKRACRDDFEGLSTDEVLALLSGHNPDEEPFEPYMPGGHLFASIVA